MTVAELIDNKISVWWAVGMRLKKTTPYTEHEICKIVCEFYKMPIDEMLKKGRIRERVEVRQACHYFCMKHIKGSQNKIASYFGQDRTTILHSVQIVNNRCDTEPDYKKEIEKLATKL